MAENSTPAPPEMTITDEGFDVSALRDISVAESVEEEKSTPEESSEEGEEDTEADDSGSDGEGETEAEDTEVSGETEETSDTETKEEPEEAKKVDETKPSKFLEAKKGEKAYKIPLDAQVSVKVDGKDVQMPISEVIKKASGVVHIEKETSKLGREKKKLDTDKAKWQEETDLINSNVQALMEMQDPFEFCSYYGQLTGKDPQAIFEGMVKKTQEYLEKFSSMTETERRLEAENRKLRINQKHREAREKRSQETQKQSQERQAVESALKNEGLTMDDFRSSLEEMQEKIANEESLGAEFDNLETLTPNDVIKYTISKQLHERTIDAIMGVNKELANEADFIDRIKKALYSTERLHGKMSSTEVRSFVKAALDVDKKHLSENLSKKVKSKTTSKPVRSDKEEDEGPATFQEYLEKRGGFKPLGF